MNVSIEDDSMPEPLARKPLFDTNNSKSEQTLIVSKKKSKPSTTTDNLSSKNEEEEDTLPISSSFAASLEAKGKLASRQRKEAALNGVSLSSGAVRAFLRTITPVLETSVSSATTDPSHVQPVDILHYVRNRHKFNYEDDVPEVLRKYGYSKNTDTNDVPEIGKRPTDVKSTDNKLEQLTSLVPTIRRAERDLMKWALATAYRQKHGIDKHGKLVGKDNNSSSGVHRSPSDKPSLPSLSSLTKTNNVNLSSSSSSPVARKRMRDKDDSNDDHTVKEPRILKATSRTETTNKRTEKVIPTVTSTTAMKNRKEQQSLSRKEKPMKPLRTNTVDETENSTEQVLKKSKYPLPSPATVDHVDNSRKLHGRGAGQFRNLDHHGEPKYQDMHPSWQAKRKLNRHQTKAVTKALRKGTGAVEEIILIKKH